MNKKVEYRKKIEESKICVLIPTYNNEQTLELVINKVKKYTNHILVVNDGSTDHTLDILQQISEIKYISYDKNRGKGFALRKGFRYAFSKGYKYAITIDSDNQHFVDDLPGFIDKSEMNPEAIIVGNRNMDQDSVPGKSSFGHKFSNFWFHVETGIKLPDTQSGYRMYPMEQITKLKYFTTKYEFEIEVLVRNVWRGVPVTSVPVKVYYAPKEKRISHFRPFRDFTRVSILNTILVFYAFLIVKPFAFVRSLNRKNIKKFLRNQIINNQESNIKIALAITLGIFMGVAPVWGYQMIIALALSHLLKLNKVITLVASNISIPPMIPLILFASFKTGELLMHSKFILTYESEISFDLIKDNLIQYIIGSLVFGAALAITIGMISFLLLHIFRKPKLKESLAK